MLSCELCEIFRDIFFPKHLWTTASEERILTGLEIQCLPTLSGNSWLLAHMRIQDYHTGLFSWNSRLYSRKFIKRKTFEWLWILFTAIFHTLPLEISWNTQELCRRLLLLLLLVVFWTVWWESVSIILWEMPAVEDIFCKNLLQQHATWQKVGSTICSFSLDISHHR